MLLHGWAMHGGVFAPLVARLAAGFTLHLVDLPGHGRSADSTIAARARRLRARRSPRGRRARSWLGWSLGGLVALHAAQQLPDSVRGLAMICASARFVRADDWPQGMDDSVFRGFADALARDYRGTHRSLPAARGARLGSRPRRDPPAAPAGVRLRRTVAASARRGPGRVAGQRPARRLAGAGNAQPVDRRPARPAGVAAGDAGLRAGRRGMVSTLRIEGGGHAPFLTHGDEVASAIRQFAAGLPA